MAQLYDYSLMIKGPGEKLMQ
uniref:Uncharacterized protein n=1 Tax=Rhizophora mucronata TaxID=61149 RepID=A0A2P2PBV6_RHIMU